MGTWINRASDANVDPGLLAWLQAAAAQSGYNVALSSGKREGDPRYHGKGMAGDIQLIDPKTGNVVPNYQNADSFSAYQQFANQVRAAQMQMDPGAANRLRWGGYFSGGKGKYGAMDLMHFDVGGSETPMGGGSWDTGLTPEQAKLWNLQPGGGYAGASAAPNQSVASAFGPPDTLVDSGPAFDLSGIGAKQKSSQPVMTAAPKLPSYPELQTTSAIPTARPAQLPTDAPTPLAELFDTNTISQIGKAGATRPAAIPGRPPLPTIGYG